MFENRVLRRTFGPKRDDETGEWRKLHIVELLNLYSSPSIIRQIQSRRMRREGHVAHMGEEIKVCRALMVKPDGRPRGIREDGIRMDLGESGWGESVDWIRLNQDREWWRALVNAVMNLLVLAPRS
jgi:hypothetical protein